MNIREDLKAYLDGELPAARMEEVRAALESDPELRSEAEFMGRLGSAIREMSAEPEIVGMEKVLGAVSGRRKQLAWPRLNWAVVGAAACVLVVLVSAQLMLPRTQLSSAADAPAPRSAASADSAESTKAMLSKSEEMSMSNSAPATANGALAGSRFALHPSASPMGAAGGLSGGKPGGVVPSAKREASRYTQMEAKHEASMATAAAPAEAATKDGRLSSSGGPWAVAATGTVMLADISIEAADVDKAAAAVRWVAEREGGHSEPGSPATPAGGQATKQVALSVPATNFSAALKDIRAVGRVLSSNLRPVSIQTARRQVADQLDALQKQTQKATGVLESSKTGRSPNQQGLDRDQGIDAEIGSLKERQKALATDNPMPIIIATIEAVTPSMPPPARYVPRAPKPASRLPMIVGAALGIVVLGGLGFLAWMRVARR